MAGQKWSAGMTAGGAVGGTDQVVGLHGLVDTIWTYNQAATFFWASPTLVTPTLGVAIGTSLALGGATLGSNALAITGGVAGSVQIWSGSVSTALSTLTGGSDGFRTSAANATQLAGENTTSSGASAGGMVGMYSNDGAAMASGDRLGGFRMGGSSSASALRNSAGLFAFADQAWVDASAYGSRLEFQTTTNNAIALSTKAILSNAGLFALGATLANTVPGIKPSSTTLAVRLGDDSADAPLSAAAGSFSGALTVTGGTSSTFAFGTITTSQPFTISQTWNAAVTFTGVLENYTSTSSNALSRFHEWQLAGAPKISLIKDGSQRWWSVYVNDTNGAWAELTTSTANTLIFGTNGNGANASTMSGLQFNVLGANKADYNVTDSVAWVFAATVRSTGNMLCAAGNYFVHNTRAGIGSPADGIHTLVNNNADNYTRLQFGGTANTFPALGRSGTALQILLADGTSGGTLQVTGTLRVDQTPATISQVTTMTFSSGADSASNIGHRISINMNGTTYWIPCSTTAF